MSKLNGENNVSNVINAELISLKKVSKIEAYNAFTDLTYFEGYFWLVFRMGIRHVSSDGAIIVCRSKDAENWEQMEILSREEVDLRDPRIIIMDGSLFILCFSLNHFSKGRSSSFKPADCFLYQYQNNKFVNIHTFKREKIPLILWDMMKIGNFYYIGGYNTDFWHRTYTIMRSDKIRGTYRKLVTLSNKEIPPNMGLSEVDFVFDEKKKLLRLLCRIDRDSTNRIDRKNKKQANLEYNFRKKNALVKPKKGFQNYFMVAKSKEPFKTWDMNLVREYIKGPRGIMWCDRLLCCGRYKEKGDKLCKIVLFEYQNGQMMPLITLAEGKDGSYAGMLINPNNSNELLISFYSDHARINTPNEGKKNDIWLAKVHLNFESP